MPIQPNGQEIRRRREGLGISVRGFAAQVKIGYSELSNIERDKKGASPETLRKISTGLKCEIEDISFEDREHVATHVPREVYNELKKYAPPGEPNWQSEVLQRVIKDWLEAKKKGRL